MTAQSSFVGAIAIGDLVKSTLGPKGMVHASADCSDTQDKILQSYSNPNNVQVTNDGATILKSIGVDNPAAKVLVGMPLPPSAYVEISPRYKTRRLAMARLVLLFFPASS